MSDTDDTSTPAPPPRTAWQNTPVIGLYNGLFDGITTVTQLRRHGSMGIGTWSHMDGEMAGVDGHFYRFLPSSKAVEPPPDATLAYAMVSFFEEDLTIPLPKGLNFQTQLQSFLDPQLSTINLIWGIRIDGRFSYVQSRSFAGAQEPPYPPTWQILEREVKHEYFDVEGTMVGFRTPTYFTSFLSIPGYHVHFLTADRKRGGHCLQFIATDAVVRLFRITKFVQALPTNEAFAQANLSCMKVVGGGCCQPSSCSPTEPINNGCCGASDAADAQPNGTS